MRTWCACELQERALMGETTTTLRALLVHEQLVVGDDGGASEARQRQGGDGGTKTSQPPDNLGWKRRRCGLQLFPVLQQWGMGWLRLAGKG